MIYFGPIFECKYRNDELIYKWIEPFNNSLYGFDLTCKDTNIFIPFIRVGVKPNMPESLKACLSDINKKNLWELPNETAFIYHWELWFTTEYAFEFKVLKENYKIATVKTILFNFPSSDNAI
jgi:hypothetical protein